MKSYDGEKPSFEELLGAWRRHMEGESGEKPRRRAREDESDGSSDWGSGDWGDWEDWFGDGSKLKAQVAEMDKQMQLMARTINMLLDRVTVLERLAVQDERRLAEEIEKLRR